MSFSYFFREGVDHHKNGEYKKALQDYSKAIELNPQYSKAYYNRGLLHEIDHFQEYEKALQDYSKVIELNHQYSPEYSEAYYNRGKLLKNHFQDYEKALQDYSRAIELNPQDSDSYNNRGNLLNNHFQDYEKALKDYEKAIELNPQYPLAYNNRGLLLKNHFQDYEKAVLDFSKVIEFDPELKTHPTLLDTPKHLQDCQQALKEKERVKVLQEQLKDIPLEKVLVSKELRSESEIENYFELFEEYFFLEARRVLFGKNEFQKCVQNLIILRQFRQFGSVIREGYHQFKNDVLKSVILETLELESELFSKIKEYSWVEEDRTETFDTLFSSGWEEKKLPEMKKTVIKILKEHSDRICIPGFSRKFKVRIRNILKLYIHSDFDHSNLVQEETKISFENEFLKSVEPIVKESMNSIQTDIVNFFKELEEYFVTCEDIIILDDEEKTPSKLKYFGLNWKNQKVGYGLVYKEFTKGGIFNRRSFYRPLFYGIFESTEHEPLSKHGDGCKEFSPNNGSLVYEGSFRNGKREGKGIEYMMMKGFGSIELPIIFEGRYSEGFRHGRGESFDPETGEVKRGEWNHGVLDEMSVFQFNCPIINYREIQKNLNDSKVVGKGASGVVYVVKTSAFSFLKNKSKKKTGRRPQKIGNEVAVKIMKTRSNFENLLIFRVIKRGIGLCFSIPSKHILDSYGIIKGPNEVGYVMELCDKSIDDIIGAEEISLKEKIRIIKETAVGMNSLHSRNVMHRDLKWGNVMRGFDRVIKLTDFDTLKEDEVQWRLRTISQSSNVGTPGFRPPEVFVGKKYTLKCDTYAFGLMIYALLWEKKFPYITQFQCSCGALMTDMVRNNKLEEHVAYCNLRPILYPDEVKKFPNFLIELMIQCWDKHPFNRPSFEEIILRFDLEDRKQFSKITLQFPSHSGVPDQKMFLTKPYERKKIFEWIEKKFNSRKTQKDIYDNSSSMTYLEGNDNEEEESEEIIQKTEVLLLEHSVLGTIFKDEEVGKIVENEQNPTFQVSLTFVDDSFIGNNSVTGRKISFEEFSKMKKENELLKKEIKLVRQRDLENRKMIRKMGIENKKTISSLETCEMEIKKLKEYLEKNQMLKKYDSEQSEDFFSGEKVEEVKEEEEEDEGEDSN